MTKFAAANGDVGGTRISVMIQKAFQNPASNSATRTASHFGCSRTMSTTRLPAARDVTTYAISAPPTNANIDAGKPIQNLNANPAKHEHAYVGNSDSPDDSENPTTTITKPSATCSRSHGA